MLRTYQRQLENLALEEEAEGADVSDTQSRRVHIENEIAAKTIELNRLVELRCWNMSGLSRFYRVSRVYGESSDFFVCEAGDYHVTSQTNKHHVLLSSTREAEILHPLRSVGLFH